MSIAAHLGSHLVEMKMAETTQQNRINMNVKLVTFVIIDIILYEQRIQFSGLFMVRVLECYFKA